MAKGESLFTKSVACILLLTAVGKIISASGDAKIIALPDPIIGVPTVGVLIGGAIVELMLAAFIIFGTNNKFKLLGIALLATNFLIYRVGYVVLGVAAPCKCLGAITDNLPFDPRHIEIFIRFLLAYMLLGSYAFLFFCKNKHLTKPEYIAGTS